VDRKTIHWEKSQCPKTFVQDCSNELGCLHCSLKQEIDYSGGI